MTFRKKLKIRLYTAIGYIIIGAALIAVSIMKLTSKEIISSFGAMFAVMGIARIFQYMRITKSEESIHAREIAETDERNVMLWTTARSLACAIYIMLAAIAVVVLYFLEMQLEAQIIGYSLFAFIVIYWLCYAVIRRKY